MESSIVGILVGGDGVRPVVALHLGLEPVHCPLPSTVDQVSQSVGIFLGNIDNRLNIHTYI